VSIIRHARENGLPFLGICLGMQCAVIEFARHVCKIEDANSSELDADCEHPVIDILAEQKTMHEKGGTMRLGAYPCSVKPGSLLEKLYGLTHVSERHRHRFEVNNSYRSILEEGGLSFCGVSPDETLVEVVELDDHPFYLGCQFHPEFKSRPHQPHPIFQGFVEAVLKKADHDS